MDQLPFIVKSYIMAFATFSVFLCVVQSGRNCIISSAFANPNFFLQKFDKVARRSDFKHSNNARSKLFFAWSPRPFLTSLVFSSWWSSLFMEKLQTAVHKMKRNCYVEGVATTPQKTNGRHYDAILRSEFCLNYGSLMQCKNFRPKGS